MAAHIACHSNQIIPNSFPPPRPTPRDHGMVSEYEAPFIMRNTRPITDVEGGTGFTKGEELGLPLLHKPTPTNTVDLSDLCDPALCLTPEKSSLRKTRTDVGSSGDKLYFKQSNSHKVRFDNFVEVKQMSPEVVQSSNENIDQNALKPRALRSECLDNSDSTGLSSSQDTTSSSLHSLSSEFSGYSDESEPISVLASDLQPSSRKYTKKSKPSDRSKKYSNLAAALSEVTLTNETPENIFARPEFNSTLKVGKELKQMKESELNVPAAVKQKLKCSEKIRTAITEKACNKVNVTTPMFSGLVSIDVREEDLISATEREKSAKVKSTVTSRASKPEDIVSPPDIMECFSSGLLRETASLTLEGIPELDKSPRTMPPNRAFDVYRHVRTWEGW